MKKETLDRANALQRDIEQIEEVLRQTGSNTHFALLEHYGNDSIKYPVPYSLTDRLRGMLQLEKTQLEKQLETLSDDNVGESVNDGGDDTAAFGESARCDCPHRDGTKIAMRLVYGQIILLVWLILSTAYILVETPLQGHLMYLLGNLLVTGGIICLAELERRRLITDNNNR